MATIARRRLLVRNPSGSTRRRKSSSTKRRKLTQKQKLAGFGGVRAKAAAKATRKRKTAAPKKRAAAKSTRKPRKRKRNPGTLTSLGLAAANPSTKRRKKGKTTMKQKRRSTRRRVAQAYAPRRRRRSNPTPVRRRRRNAAPRRRARRRVSNPAGGRVGGLVVKAGWTIAGAVGTRAVTQIALGPKNSGPMGYLANAGVALGMGLLGRQAFGKAAGEMLTLGGFIGLVMRVIQEQTALGSAVSLGRLGDAPFARLSGRLRGYQPMSFFSPLASADPTGQTAAAKPPAMLTDAVAALPPAVSNGNGVSGLGMGRSRYGGARVWAA